MYLALEKRNLELNQEWQEIEKEKQELSAQFDKINSEKNTLKDLQNATLKENKKLKEIQKALEKEKQLYKLIDKVIAEYSDINPNVPRSKRADYSRRYREQQTTLDLIEALTKELNLHEEYKELINNRRPSTDYSSFGFIYNASGDY